MCLTRATITQGSLDDVTFARFPPRIRFVANLAPSRPISARFYAPTLPFLSSRSPFQPFRGIVARHLAPSDCFASVVGKLGTGQTENAESYVNRFISLDAKRE